MEIEFSKNLTLTTDHPESRYGAGVLLDSDGKSYRPWDTLPESTHRFQKLFGVEVPAMEAGEFVQRNAVNPPGYGLIGHDCSTEELELVRKFLSQDPEKRFELPSNEEIQKRKKKVIEEFERGDKI